MNSLNSKPPTTHTEPILASGFRLTPILNRGRPRGSGKNLKLISKLKPGDINSCIWGLTKGRKDSIRTSAGQHGIKVKTRLLDDGLYAVWRVN